VCTGRADDPELEPELPAFAGGAVATVVFTDGVL
jgi:hypothetical protein